MSLRSYLFLLIGGLIALLTLIQLAIVYWIETNLAIEVDKKARSYSRKIIELAVDQLDANPQALRKIIKEKVKTNESSEVEDIHVYNLKSDHVIAITADDINKDDVKVINEVIIDAQTIASSEQQIKITKKLLKKEFETIVEQLHQQVNQQESANHEFKTFVVQTPNVVSHSWVNQPTNSENTKSLFRKIQLMLIIVAVIGLLFAFWLSAKFNQPLKELALGFKKLANGDDKPEVKEQGVKEIRTTILQFNAMVTHLAKLTEAEKQHKEMAHLAELGEVSRGLAHALRNPIHTIGLSIEQLQENHLSIEQNNALLSRIQDKISHLDKNIKALLTLTTSGIVRDEKIPLLAVVQDIILEYKSSVTHKINFNVQIEPSMIIEGAESEIRSILHTLIYNACEASQANDEVFIKSEISDNTIKLITKDTGSGLEPHIAEQLFQPHISSKPEGAGMGLYIAKRLISLHYHGELSLINNNDKGCTAIATFGVNSDEY